MTASIFQFTRPVQFACRHLYLIFVQLLLPVGIYSQISFNEDVRPILSANCFSCHGPDEKSRKAKLRLDVREGALADLGGYRALEPGKADDSELILRVESKDEDEVMPPPDSGHALTASDRKILRAWVDAGGEYDVHWSFKRPLKALITKDISKGLAPAPSGPLCS